MSKNLSRLTITRNAAAAVLIGLTLALSANASTGTGYAFIDSIAEFFGVTTTENNAQTEQAMEPNSSAPMAPFANSCTFTSTGTMNWSGGTWTKTAPGTGCGAYPGELASGDIVVIAANHTVTLNVSPANSIATLTLNTASGNMGVTFSGTNTLTVSGTATITDQNSSGSVNSIAVGAGTLNAGSISITGSNGARASAVTLSTGTINVTGDITFGAGQSGNQQLNLSSTGTLNIGGANGIDTGGTFNPGTTSTVNYNRAGTQTALPASYANLTISGSGAKTFATTPTVTDTLSMEGTATIVATSGAVTYGSAATLQYNTATSRTSSSEEWITPFTASGGVIIANTGTITLDASKTFSSNAPLTINSGATLNPGATSANTISGGSTLTVNGTLDFSDANGLIQSGTTGTSTLTMGPSGLIRTVDPNGLGPVAFASFSTQSGGAWSFSNMDTVGTVEYNRNATSGQAVTDRNYNNLTITGSTQTKTWTIAATRTINGNVTINASAPLTMSGVQTLNVGGNWTNGGTFTNGGGTVALTGGTQSIGGSSASAFTNLTIAGTSGVKTLASNTTITSTLSIAPTGSSTASLNAGTTYTVPNLTLGGFGRVNGTWGSTSSSATNQNNSFFAATTGIVSVTNDTRLTPTLSVTNSPVTYNASPQSAAVSGSVAGTVSNILTGGAATQTNAATYAVTANFVPTDTTTYKSLSGASAGNFIINKAAASPSVTNSPQTYTGSPIAATVSCAGGGASSNIKYNTSATIPTNAGTYAITANSRFKHEL